MTDKIGLNENELKIDEIQYSLTSRWIGIDLAFIETWIKANSIIAIDLYNG